MSFDALQAELEALQVLKKSIPEADTDGDDDDEAGEEAAESDESKDEESLGKSLTVTTKAGEELEAIDGTELVKSLLSRLDTNEEAMQKALSSMVDLIKSQGEQITHLTDQLKSLRSEGRGRKAVVSVAEKPQALQKSEPEGITGNDFLAKALEAQKAGRLSGVDVSIAEAALLKGIAIPDAIVKRVLS